MWTARPQVPAASGALPAGAETVVSVDRISAKARRRGVCMVNPLPHPAWLTSIGRGAAPAGSNRHGGRLVCRYGSGRTGFLRKPNRPRRRCVCGRRVMNLRLAAGAVALMLAGGAAAQTGGLTEPSTALQLTPQQRATIYR